MYNIYIMGWTFHITKEIKELKPKTKDFKTDWKYWKNTYPGWHLRRVPKKYMTKEYINQLEEFCLKHELVIEIDKVIEPRVKNITEYDTEEEFFEAFHRRNKPYG